MEAFAYFVSVVLVIAFGVFLYKKFTAPKSEGGQSKFVPKQGPKSHPDE